MNSRTLIVIVGCLAIAALGGFYFALGPHSNGTLVPSAPPSPAPASAPAAPAPVASTPVTSVPAAPPPAPAAAPSPIATAQSIEAEIARSEHAELQTLLKKNFAGEYNELIAVAVRRRNEGVSDLVFGQELAERFQAVMRGKLKYGIGASMPTIDRLAGNEASLFHALGTEGSALCLKMLGKDDSPATTVTPESVRQLMRLGTLYRFQAIVEGMPSAKPVDALTTEETRAFEASLTREGLNYRDVSTGAYLNKGGAGPGRPCLTLETLHVAIARLPDKTRRKIYAGMFFLGRDK